MLLILCDGTGTLAEHSSHGVGRLLAARELLSQSWPNRINPGAVLGEVDVADKESGHPIVFSLTFR